ncbi:MAG: TRAP transporter small permease [Phycisphaerae bacterium]|nr:TRAP transporter small permease [Phycisphaerae bacterium]
MLTLIKKILNWFLETLLTVVMAVLVLDVVWQVIARWIINRPNSTVGEWLRNLFTACGINPTFSWTEELATYLMIWVGMLGASVALNRGSHLGIDYMVSKFSVMTRIKTEVFVFICIGLFSLVGMLIGGILLVSKTFELGQTSPAMKLPIGYVYLAVPISGFFLVIYSIELLMERIVTLRKGPDVSQAVQARATLD